MKILVALILCFSSFGYAALQTIPANGQLSYPSSPPAQTFAAVSALFGPPATPTDICSLSGSTGTKIIKVYKVRLSSTQSTAGINNWFIVKRSAVDTAGTSVSITPILHDSFEIAATGVPKYWTANPGGLGAVVGTVRSALIPAPVPASNANAFYEFDFGPNTGGKAIVLRNSAETVALNFGGAALPTGLSTICEFMWTEENP
jgi:hypothetical protein